MSPTAATTELGTKVSGEGVSRCVVVGRGGREGEVPCGPPTMTGMIWLARRWGRAVELLGGYEERRAEERSTLDDWEAGCLDGGVW